MFLVCGFLHRLSGNRNFSMKLKACEKVFVRKSTRMGIVFPEKLVSHENLLGFPWKRSGVRGSSWSGIRVSEDMRQGSVWKQAVGNAHP